MNKDRLLKLSVHYKSRRETYRDVGRQCKESYEDGTGLKHVS
jgi:hypothetical protein